MNKATAQQRILEQYQIGLISLDEAQTAQSRILQISGSNRYWKQKEALYAIWAGA